MMSLFFSSAFFMMMLANPISHRYFLIIYILLIVGALYFIQILKSTLLKIVISVFFVAVIISGNFWMYPQKYGNGWDSSLKVLPFFKMEDQMRSFIVKNKINPIDVNASFPLHKNYIYTYLLDEDYKYSDIDKSDIDSCKYFLNSNICNYYNPELLKKIENNWLKISEIRSKNIFLTLYKNPKN